MKVLVIEKMEDGVLNPIDVREWNDSMVAMLHHSNYLLVNGKEYEMVEGRLNVNDQQMELLVLAIKQDSTGTDSLEKE